jgi:hypothetical protein
MKERKKKLWSSSFYLTKKIPNILFRKENKYYKRNKSLKLNIKKNERQVSQDKATITDLLCFYRWCFYNNRKRAIFQVFKCSYSM